MIKAWDENSGKKIQDILDIYTNSKIKGYVITDIQNDGMLWRFSPEACLPSPATKNSGDSNIIENIINNLYIIQTSVNPS